MAGVEKIMRVARISNEENNFNLNFDCFSGGCFLFVLAGVAGVGK